MGPRHLKVIKVYRGDFVEAKGKPRGEFNFPKFFLGRLGRVTIKGP